jgi:hypothetical protein
VEYLTISTFRPAVSFENAAYLKVDNRIPVEYFKFL